jgi:hypothetical protein
MFVIIFLYHQNRGERGWGGLRLRRYSQKGHASNGRFR